MCLILGHSRWGVPFAPRVKGKGGIWATGRSFKPMWESEHRRPGGLRRPPVDGSCPESFFLFGTDLRAGIHNRRQRQRKAHDLHHHWSNADRHATARVPLDQDLGGTEQRRDQQGLCCGQHDVQQHPEVPRPHRCTGVARVENAPHTSGPSRWLGHRGSGRHSASGESTTMFMARNSMTSAPHPPYSLGVVGGLRPQKSNLGAEVRRPTPTTIFGEQAALSYAMYVGHIQRHDGTNTRDALAFWTLQHDTTA